MVLNILKTQNQNRNRKLHPRIVALNSKTSNMGYFRVKLYINYVKKRNWRRLLREFLIQVKISSKKKLSRENSKNISYVFLYFSGGRRKASAVGMPDSAGVRETITRKRQEARRAGSACTVHMRNSTSSHYLLYLSLSLHWFIGVFHVCLHVCSFYFFCVVHNFHNVLDVCLRFTVVVFPADR